MKGSNMRGKTAKRLRMYANFLKNDNPEKYEALSAHRIYQRLKKVWMKDKAFQKFIYVAFKAK